MEITKINESYSIKDKSDLGWEMTGNAYVEVNGNMNLNGDVRDELGDHIGNFSYHKPVEGHVNMSINVAEEKRDAFVKYVDTIIKAASVDFE